MKVFIGWFGHECNSMAQGLTEYSDVIEGGWRRGPQVIDYVKGKNDFLGGIVDFCLEHNVEMVCSVRKEVAAPPLSKECIDTVMDQILEDLNSCKDEIDGICFVLHGAGCAVGIDDLESYTLKKFREIVGDQMPITVPLDLHGNISKEMTELADGLFGCKEYPHTDQYDASYIAMKALYESLNSGRKLKTVYRRLPFVLPAAAGYTQQEPLLSLNKYTDEFTKEKGLVYASFFHGFPYADVACLSSSILVTGYEDQDLESAADQLYQYVMSRMDEFLKPVMGLEEAFEEVHKFKGEGYIVLNEASDNPGGGAPGDGTHLLREMIRQDIPGSVFCFLCDPIAVKEIAKAMPGDLVDVTIGGRKEKLHGEPIELHGAKFISMFDGKTLSVSPMSAGLERNFGLSVRIKVGNVDICIGTARIQTMDDRMMIALGIEPEKCRIIGLKSTHHFRAYFQDKAAKIIPVETPGVQGANLKIFTYNKIVHPLLPIDDHL